MSHSTLDRFLAAATRENTRQSYASALRHFEESWGGFLPAAPDSVARYLAEHAETLSYNTLRHRLAALAHWHADQGFADPTRAPIVKQVLKGIRALHPLQEKRAEPLQLAQLSQVSDWLDHAQTAAEKRQDLPNTLRHRRDKALLLLGFWRGFRGDELIRLQVEHLTLVPGHGLTCFLLRTKADRGQTGTTLSVPALSHLCPVQAVHQWVSSAEIAEGPLFRRIDRWGRLSDQGLHPNSLIRLLRRIFRQAGLPSPDGYSGHSLRRGFAGWANAHGWDVSSLMDYVGWKDMQAALRYLDGSDPFQRARFEVGLASDTQRLASINPPLPTEEGGSETLESHDLLLRLVLEPRRRGARRTRVRRLIEDICLAPHQAIPLNAEHTHYRLSVTTEDETVLEETLALLLDDLHRLADNHDCDLDASLDDKENGRHWD